MGVTGKDCIKDYVGSIYQPRITCKSLIRWLYIYIRLFNLSMLEYD